MDIIFKLRLIFPACVVCLLLPPICTADTCGVSQSCFRSPDGCFPPSACDYFVGWSLSNSGDALDFEFSMSGNNGYIALGFSKSMSMNLADIIGCLSDNRILRYYVGNSKTTPGREPDVGLSNEVITIGDGNSIHCTFTRQLSLVGQTNFFDLNEAHYLILAEGGRIGDSMSYHGFSNRWQSSVTYNLKAADFRPQTTTQRPVTNTLAAGSSPPLTSSFFSLQPPTGGMAKTEAKSTVTPDVTMATPTLVRSEGDTCGVSQSCYRSPNNCYPASTCTYFVGWSLSENQQALNFEFSMSGNNGYIALGFSKDGKMPNSDVLICLSNGDLNRYYLSDRSDPTKQNDNGISEEEVEVSDGGVIDCSFTRQLSRDDQLQFFDLNENHFIILANGDRDGEVIKYHGNARYSSASSFDFTSEELTVDGDSGKDDSRAKMIKAHGSLMIISWIGLVSIGIVTARFMKQAFPSKKLCGKPFWFRVHAGCMIAAWVTFISSFILIFVTAEGWVGRDRGDNTFSHAIIGTVAVGLGTLNPIMAIFRPHPGTPRRPIFNVLHFAVGVSGWLSANVATFYGVRIHYFDSNKATEIDAFNVLIGFAIFLVLMFVAFEIQARSSKNQAVSDSVQLDPITDTPFHEKNQPNQRTDKPVGTAVRNILYLLYIIGVLLTVVYLVVTIVIKDT